MKIRCMVIDDERLALEVMENYIEKVSFLRLDSLCATPLQALDFLSRNVVDVIFLDIEMPGLNGLQFLKTLKDPPLIILTTAFPQFAVDAFELDVFDYLLKPIPLARFLKSVQKLQAVLKQENEVVAAPVAEISPDHYIFIKSGSKTVRVDFKEILFAEGKKDHTLIHLRESRIVTQLSLAHLVEKLPAERFTRVHRSFLIALDKIASIEKSRIEIGNTFIPVGDYYRDDFFRRIG